MTLSFIDYIFFFYMFIGLYMLSLFILIYIQNRKELFSYPPAKPKSVSIIIPCYNESVAIGKTIESLLALNYPKQMIEIIVVDDKSTDDSVKIIKEYVRKYKNVKLIVNKKNSGGAAEPTNIGVQAAKSKYVAVTDADSTPEPDALIKMIGFLQANKKTAAVTCAVIAKEPRTFMQKLQAIEYIVISFSRKLLDCIDAVYVTPGPFALYDKKVLVQVGLFDTKNLTQDIEIVWRLKANDYAARMCLPARVYSDTPKRFRAWWRQRIRWNIGGTQTIIKYKKIALQKGMLGLFILPFFTISLFLGLFGLAIFAYLVTRRILVSYLSTKYSIYAQTAVLHLTEFTFAPTVLNFFGAALFFLGLGFTIIVLTVMNVKQTAHNNAFNILYYMLVYLTVYPFISLTALYKLVRKKHSW